MIKRNQTLRKWAVTFIALFAIASQPAYCDRIKDLTTVAGQRPNQLVGYGLVMGLDGSGDQTTQTPFTIQSVLQMLSVLGITVPTTGTQAQLRNTAAVMVTAELPPLGRPGQQIDVTVSSIGNATSLKGGTLVMTPLRAADGQVYAQAQGSLVIGGAGAAGSRIQVTAVLFGQHEEFLERRCRHAGMHHHSGPQHP